MYARLRKKEREQYNQMYDLAKLICSFVNPEAAKTYFSTKPETIENAGFYDDLKKLDPNFDASKYTEMLE
jgi:hypothetical protein